jgi:hypothetical protein
VPQFENCGDSSLQRAQHGGLTLGILPSPPYSSFDPLTNKETGIDNRRATLFIVLLGFGCLVGRVFWYHNAQIQHVDLSRAPLLQGIGGLPLLALVTINIRSTNLTLWSCRDAG